MYAEVLKQKVNFYLSVAFILTFGSFMTITIVNAIQKDSPYLKAIDSSSVQDQ
jgi:nitrate/nitrite transporter NarK